jgi:hypothetical protein
VRGPEIKESSLTRPGPSATPRKLATSIPPLSSCTPPTRPVPDPTTFQTSVEQHVSQTQRTTHFSQSKSPVKNTRPCTPTHTTAPRPHARRRRRTIPPQLHPGTSYAPYTPWHIHTDPRLLDALHALLLSPHIPFPRFETGSKQRESRPPSRHTTNMRRTRRARSTTSHSAPPAAGVCPSDHPVRSQRVVGYSLDMCTSAGPAARKIPCCVRDGVEEDADTDG